MSPCGNKTPFNFRSVSVLHFAKYGYSLKYGRSNQQFGLILQHLFGKILGLIQNIRQQRAAGYDRSVLQLELIFHKVDKAGKATLKDALAGTRYLLTAYAFLPDYYFIVAGLTMVVLATQLFVVPGVDYGLARPVLFLASGVLAGVVPMLVAFITWPPHLLFKANIWVSTFVNIVISALAFAYVQPVFAKFILDDGILSFQRLAWPMFVFYFFAEFYMLMRLNQIVNFNIYIARHASDGIEKFIPAHKLGPIMSLSAQDHYVEIATSKGTHLERITIKKAIEMVPDDAGLQVHRSHWVAYEAILTLEKTGERYAVLLRNGAKLPVGKSKVQELECYLDRR